MARDFNGTTDRIDWSSVYNLTSGPLTFSAWIYLDALTTSNQYIIGMNSGSTATALVFSVLSSGRLSIARVGSTQLTKQSASSTITTGEWVHVLVTHDGTFTDHTTIHFYKNGTETSYFSGTNGVAPETAATGTWYIGGRTSDDARNLNGRIGEVAVWNAVLGSSAITALGSGDSPDFYQTNLQFYWKGKADSLVASPGGTGTADGTSDYTSSFPAIRYPSSVSGTVTPAGALVNAARKVLAGVLTTAGDLSTIFTGGGGGTEYEQTVSGSISPSGTLTNSTRKALAGTLTSAGDVLKRAGKALSGAIAPTTNAILSKVNLVSLSGTLTSAGAVVKQTAKSLAGTLTTSGEVATELSGGPITVTPGAVACIVRSIAPSVILGSIAATPAVAAAVVQTVAPTTVLGSIVAVPVVASHVVRTIAPAVVLGSITAIPAFVSAVIVLVSNVNVVNSGDVDEGWKWKFGFIMLRLFPWLN